MLIVILDVMDEEKKKLRVFLCQSDECGYFFDHILKRGCRWELHFGFTEIKHGNHSVEEVLNIMGD